MADPPTQFHLSRFFQALSSEESAWGKARTEVDVSAGRALAYMWHLMSYMRCAPRDPKLLCTAVDLPNTHSMYQVFEKTVSMAANRVFGERERASEVGTRAGERSGRASEAGERASDRSGGVSEARTKYEQRSRASEAGERSGRASEAGERASLRL
jgi:hypothetical protein